MRTAKYHVAPLLAAVLASGPALRIAGAAGPESQAISGIVSDNVQKVGFRAMIFKQAIEYNLAGSAQNAKEERLDPHDLMLHLARRASELAGFCQRIAAVTTSDPAPCFVKFVRLIPAAFEPMLATIPIRFCCLPDFVKLHDETFGFCGNRCDDDPPISQKVIRRFPKPDSVLFPQGFDLYAEMSTSSYVIGKQIDATGILRRWHHIPAPQRQLIRDEVHPDVSNHLLV